MPQALPFTKASGAGNDFVLIDNLGNNITYDKSRLAMAVCSRHFGVGADGLILLEPSSRSDFFMRYYNADGSYGGMCGNGGRCVARYAHIHGIAGATMTFEALDHVYTAEVLDSIVRLSMKDPSRITPNVQVHVRGTALVGNIIHTGSPHVVFFQEDLDSADVTSLGHAVRHHEMFRPDGTNVDFVELHPEGVLRIRTYERGVEAETLACGTGAVASAIVASVEKGMKAPIRLRVQSGEELRVDFEVHGSGVDHVVLEGSAHMLFAGTLAYDPVTFSISDMAHSHSISP